MVRDVLEDPGADRGGEVRDRAGHRAPRLEAEHVLDLVEGDSVVASVHPTLDPAHGSLAAATRVKGVDGGLDDHPLRVVAVLTAQVEDLAGHQVRRRLERHADPLCDVVHVGVGPPGVGVVHVELVAERQLAGELRDGEVEAHPLRHPVGGRDPHHGGVEPLQGLPEQALLDLDLVLRVDREGLELVGLDRGGVVLVAQAIVAAGRGEDETLGAAGGGRLRDPQGTVHVHLGGDLGVPLADGVADQRGEQDDVGDAVHRPGQVLVGANVAADEAEALVVGQARQRHAVAVDQGIEDPDLGVSRAEEVARQRGPDVAGAAGHEHLPVGVHSAPRVVVPPVIALPIIGRTRRNLERGRAIRGCGRVRPPAPARRVGPLPRSP